MKFSALVGEGLRIVHVKFQLSVTLGAGEIRLERKRGLFYATKEVAYKLTWVNKIMIMTLQADSGELAFTLHSQYPELLQRLQKNIPRCVMETFVLLEANAVLCPPASASISASR